MVEESASQSKEQLRFVTITDLSQRETARNRKIVRSHAMRYAHKNIRLSATKPPGPEVSNYFGVFSKDGEASRGSNEATRPEVGVAALLTKHGWGSKVKRGSISSQDRELIERWKQLAPDPITLIGAGRVDPFTSCCPVKPKPYIDFLVDHYVNVLSPSQIPVPGPLNPLVTLVLPLARSNPVLFHGILCLAASHVTTVRGSQRPGYWARYHRDESFRLLNAALADPNQATDDLTVATILIVSGHDVLFGSHNVHEEHMKGLDRIIAIRGGPDKLGLDGLLERLYGWASHFRALRTATTTEEPSEEATPDPPDTNINLSQSDNLIPSTFLSLHSADHLSTTLLASLHLLCTLTSTLHTHSNPNAHTSTATIVSSTAMNTFNSQRNQLERQLNHQREHLSKNPKGSIEECVCLATLMYSHSMLRQLPPTSGVYPGLNAQLRTALAKLGFRAHWGQEWTTLLWIAFMGGMTAVDRSEKSWWAAIVRGVLREHQDLGTTDRAPLMDLLRRFFWCDMYEAPGRELWELMRDEDEKAGSLGAMDL